MKCFRSIIATDEPIVRKTLNDNAGKQMQILRHGASFVMSKRPGRPGATPKLRPESLPPNGPIGAGPWASSPTPFGRGAVSWRRTSSTTAPARAGAGSSSSRPSASAWPATSTTWRSMDIRGNPFILGYRAPAAHAGRAGHSRGPPVASGSLRPTGMAKTQPGRSHLQETEAGEGQAARISNLTSQPQPGHGEYKRANLHTIGGFSVAAGIAHR